MTRKRWKKVFIKISNSELGACAVLWAWAQTGSINIRCGKNTQGLSDYLKKSFSGQDIKVAIAYDCRNNSQELARVVAEVFSANGIYVYLFSKLRPTPELSFAVRFLDCQCGIVLTASHNPPEYNGYKVYWQDGGQLVPPQDGEIVKMIEDLDYDQINFGADQNRIEMIDHKVDNAFIKAALKNGSFKALDGQRDQTTIAFTSLHGTSITLIPQVLEKAGYKNVHIVEQQEEPDGKLSHRKIAQSRRTRGPEDGPAAR